MKINLFQIVPSKLAVQQSSLTDGSEDVLYCNGIDCISHCLAILFDRGYRNFQVNYLGEVLSLTDDDLINKL